MTDLLLHTDFETDTCSCGGTYALQKRFLRQAHELGKQWWCPYCGASRGYGETASERLERQLVQERQRHDQTRAELNAKRAEAERIERRRRATVGAKTKIEKRIKHGVCPCCRRTFQNLRDHMHHEHPNYATTTEIEA